VKYGEKIANQDYIKRDGVYGISFSNDHKVTLVKVPYGYFLPGGGVENDESHECCLKREYIEEVGYTIEIIEFVGCASQYTFSHKKNRHYELVGNFYLVEIKDCCEGKIEHDHELVWRDIAEVPYIMNLEYQEQSIINAYKKFIQR